MASVFTPISAVSGGKKDLKLKVRIAHIWCIPDKDRPNEISCMNLLLVDEKVCFQYKICRFILYIMVCTICSLL
jgi:hypothetical protein